MVSLYSHIKAWPTSKAPLALWQQGHHACAFMAVYSLKIQHCRLKFSLGLDAIDSGDKRCLCVSFATSRKKTRAAQQLWARWGEGSAPRKRCYPRPGVSRGRRAPPGLAETGAHCDARRAGAAPRAPTLPGLTVQRKGREQVLEQEATQPGHLQSSFGTSCAHRTAGVTRRPRAPFPAAAATPRALCAPASTREVAPVGGGAEAGERPGAGTLGGSAPPPRPVCGRARPRFRRPPCAPCPGAAARGLRDAPSLGAGGPRAPGPALLALRASPRPARPRPAPAAAACAPRSCRGCHRRRRRPRASSYFPSAAGGAAGPRDGGGAGGGAGSAAAPPPPGPPPGLGSGDLKERAGRRPRFCREPSSLFPLPLPPSSPLAASSAS